MTKLYCDVNECDKLYVNKLVCDKGVCVCQTVVCDKVMCDIIIIIMIIIISGTFFSQLKTPLSHIRPYPKMGVGSNAKPLG